MNSYNTPLVSVIVPVYKVEPYLSRCVDSILSQTYQRLEIFLVDDGSPDKCGEICDAYAQIDGRIKVIHKVNGGLSDARNVAIDVATGEYLVFIDSDDFVSPTHIEKLILLIHKYQADISITTFCSFLEGTMPNPRHKGNRELLFSGLQAVEAMFYQGLFDNSAWGKMYHISVFKGIRYPRGLLYEDMPTTYKLLLKASRVAYSNDDSYYYLLRANSIEGSQFTSEKLDSALKLIDMMESDRDRLQPILRSFYCRLVSFAFHLGMQMPNDYERKDVFFNLIKQYRRVVICDKRARKKTRLACLLSFFGFKIVNRIFSIFKSR